MYEIQCKFVQVLPEIHRQHHHYDVTSVILYGGSKQSIFLQAPNEGV